MLTKQQVKEFELLIPTIDISKYKTFIERIYMNWKITKRGPSLHHFGVGVEGTKIQELDCSGCCAIGSYMIGLDVVDGYHSFAWHWCDHILSVQEIVIVINVFDYGGVKFMSQIDHDILLTIEQFNRLRELAILIDKVRGICFSDLVKTVVFPKFGDYLIELRKLGLLKIESVALPED